MLTGLDDSKKNFIAEFCSSYTLKNGKAPSISTIVENTGTNKVELYRLFPGGQVELCKLAGVPLPRERVDRLVNANEARRTSLSPSIAPAQLTLTEEQTMRILAVSHLEHGRDPLQIVDDLLNNDSTMRNGPDLTFADVARVRNFLESMKWADRDAVAFLKRLSNLGIDNLPPDIAQALISVATEAAQHGWNIPEFVREATGAHTMMGLYTKCRTGEISALGARQNILALTG
jgi:hypothetical protein